jgi:two-component SAPR family response regulator
MSLALPRTAEKIVLLVDDEVAYLDLLEQLLSEHLACTVRSFTTPTKALEILPSLNVGLIITDYQMPDMNGLQFMAEVQKIYPALPAVMITAYQLEFSRSELDQVPSLKAIVRKPFKWKTLAEHIVKYWPDQRPPAVIGSGSTLP